MRGSGLRSERRVGRALALALVAACNRGSAPAQEMALDPEDVGTLVRACDDAGKCRGGWTCFDDRCIPRELMNNPALHREPLLFVFMSFEAIVSYGARRHADGRYHCPGARDGLADTGLTPPANIDCSAGPEGRCVPDGDGRGAYPSSLWDHPGWKDIDLRTTLPHRFHYRYVGEEEASPEGRCLFMVQAFGDLDGDGIFSTFERSGMYDHTGPNAAAGLYIEPDLQFE